MRRAAQGETSVFPGLAAPKIVTDAALGRRAVSANGTSYFQQHSQTIFQVGRRGSLPDFFCRAARAAAWCALGSVIPGRD